MTLAPGTRLGHYEILGPLGVGGMGEVYRARDKKLDRQVAVKVLPEAVASDRDRLARFEREAKTIATLSHPNILAIFDFRAHDGITYAAMELLEGETLRQRLAGGALPLRKAIDYGAQIAKGLAAAHERNVVHRDLKPENVLVTPDGRVKILDFGLARQGAVGRGDAGNSPTVTRETDPGSVLGTVGYMSPEQVRGLPADSRCDIFSLGRLQIIPLPQGLPGFRRHGRTQDVPDFTDHLAEAPEERLFSPPLHRHELGHRRAALRDHERLAPLRNAVHKLQTSRLELGRRNTGHSPPPPHWSECPDHLVDVKQCALEARPFPSPPPRWSHAPRRGPRSPAASLSIATCSRSR